MESGMTLTKDDNKIQISPLAYTRREATEVLTAMLGCRPTKEMIDADVRKARANFEVSRRSADGSFVNLGQTFSKKEVSQIRTFVKSAKRYLTWDRDWKPFLAKLNKGRG
jgi:hypothetical protein